MKRSVCWAAVAAVLLAYRPATAQQGSLQIIGATQIATGDPLRLGGQRQVEPDLGILFLEPGFRLGTLQIDAHLTRSGDRPAVGRALFGLSNVKARGLVWNINVGDTYITPVVSDVAFANLFAPSVTFQGASVSGQNRTTSISAAAGRVTTLRNIFGTDADTLDQTLVFTRVRQTRGRHLAWSARASHVQSGALKEFTSYVRTSDDYGGGVQYTTGSVDFIADGGWSAYRRQGAPEGERQASGLVGATWVGQHGFVQANAQRFSLGRLAVVNFPFNDRTGLFASGERDLGKFLRAFGGWEAIKTSLDPEAAERASFAPPSGVVTRGFGGLRLRLGNHSVMSTRFETGDRTIRPSRFSAGFESDTGSVNAEWHGTFSLWNAFGRYARRSNVDLENSAGTSTEHDASGHLYMSLSPSSQLFVNGAMTRRQDADGGGQVLWQIGGGGQWQIPKRGVFARVEGSATHTVERITELVTTRAAVNSGLIVPIGQRTTVSVDVFVDHSPVAFVTANPWLTRSMIRVTRTITTGTARAAGQPGLGARSGPMGTIAGTVYVDWNGDGIQDPGEEPAAGIVVALGTFASVQTGGDGRFTFVSVPVGEQVVGLDLSALPATYDPPTNPSATVSVARGKPAATTIGVVPLGTIRGRVYQDVNGDGRLGPEDQPLDGAVALLDEGARSERARNGRFEFDGVRPGTHQVELVLESLPDGALLTGERSGPVELSRDQMVATVDFLVRVDKRPEIRRVFPVKK